MSDDSNWSLDAQLQTLARKLPDPTEATPLPESVYHYTDQSGLLGILKDGELWATDYRYLNDSSELSYTFSLAQKMLGERFPRDQNPGTRGAFLDLAAGPRPDAYTREPYYLCCFSRRDNSLSQWRAYGGKQGFSLEFPGDISPSPNYSPKSEGQAPGLTLMKVNYSRKVQEEFISTLITEFLSLCGSSELTTRFESRVAAAKILVTNYWSHLERVSYLFKHPDFADEGEWRLVFWGSQRSECFRVGRTITPYVKVKVFSRRQAATTPLPVSAVRHGPSTLPDETAYALDRLLTARGYPDDLCGRLGSDTPARL